MCFQKYWYQTDRATYQYQILKSTYAPKNQCLEPKIDATKSFKSNSGFSWPLVFQILGPALGQFHHESDLSDVKVQNTPPKMNSSPLKNWKMLEAYFQGLTVKFPGCKCQTSQQFPFFETSQWPACHRPKLHSSKTLFVFTNFWHQTPPKLRRF